MDRREFLVTAALGSRLSALRPSPSAESPKPRAFARPLPSAAQLQWQRDEMAMFLHFGVNTFTDREWGDGKEDPAIFNPTALDARQWARAAKAGGFKAMILTAKHHDGFCLWPTGTTKHSVSSSPFRSGQGDVVREFVDACRAEGLRPGLYLSPWDRNHPTYGDSPKYMDVYIAQLAELCTRYGPLAEVWFDGANGEGPNGKRQVYDWPRIWGTVRRLQPDAVMFSDAGPDVRWCGNERGEAGDPNWSTVDPAAVPYPGADGPGIIAALQHGDPNGSVWRPAEVDVSIRPGWFHHPKEDGRVRQSLLDLMLSSVGRNGKLLLNVPPTRDGLLHQLDTMVIASSWRSWKAGFDAEERIVDRKWSAGDRSAVLELQFGRATNPWAVRLGEDIENRGQIVSKFIVSGFDDTAWSTLAQGSTIGYARIALVKAQMITRLRIELETVDTPTPINVAAYVPDV